jgi:hypothetical protein
MWTVVLEGATYVSTFGSLAYAPSARGLGGVRLAHVLRTSVLGRRAGLAIT